MDNYRPAPKSLLSRIVASSGGLIANEKQALYVAFTFVIIATLTSVVLLFSDNKTGEAPSQTLLNSMPVNTRQQ